jgi:hypothetical protein
VLSRDDRADALDERGIAIHAVRRQQVLIAEHQLVNRRIRDGELQERSPNLRRCSTSGARSPEVCGKAKSSTIVVDHGASTSV